MVSGNIFRRIKKPAKAIIPNKKKLIAFPKLDNSHGKTSCTKELINELIKAMTPIAKPLYFNGLDQERKLEKSNLLTYFHHGLASTEDINLKSNNSFLHDNVD